MRHRTSYQDNYNNYRACRALSIDTKIIKIESLLIIECVNMQLNYLSRALIKLLQIELLFQIL